MKTRIMALVVFNMLATFSIAAASEQAQWNERAVQGGVEFRLLNDEGTAIVLQCTDQEVHATFVFTEPIGTARSALVLGRLTRVEPGSIRPPTMRRSFPVAQVNDRTVQIDSRRGLNFTLAALAAAVNIHVRTAGGRASFEVAGSDLMLAKCTEAENKSRARYGSAYDRFSKVPPGALRGWYRTP